MRPWQDSFGGQQNSQAWHWDHSSSRFFKQLSTKNKLSSCNTWHGIDTVPIKREIRSVMEKQGVYI